LIYVLPFEPQIGSISLTQWTPVIVPQITLKGSLVGFAGVVDVVVGRVVDGRTFVEGRVVSGRTVVVGRVVDGRTVVVGRVVDGRPVVEERVVSGRTDVVGRVVLGVYVDVVAVFVTANSE
jgi:hypothetical protein